MYLNDFAQPFMWFAWLGISFYLFRVKDVSLLWKRWQRPLPCSPQDMALKGILCFHFHITHGLLCALLSVSLPLLRTYLTNNSRPDELPLTHDVMFEWWQAPCLRVGWKANSSWIRWLLIETLQQKQISLRDRMMSGRLRRTPPGSNKRQGEINTQWIHQTFKMKWYSPG